MNYTNHCLQSHFSLAEQGRGGSLLKRRHQSENTITHFHWEEKQCCPCPPRAVVLQPVAAARGGHPTAGRCSCPLLPAPGRHTKSPVLNMRWTFFGPLSCPLPLFACISYMWVTVTQPLSCPAICWDLLGTFGMFKMEVVLHRAVLGTQANILLHLLLSASSHLSKSLCSLVSRFPVYLSFLSLLQYYTAKFHICLHILTFFLAIHNSSEHCWPVVLKSLCGNSSQ